MPSKPSARTWGTRFDSLPPPASPESCAATMESSDHLQDSAPSEPFVKTAERNPHDASIFVGSLPVHVDREELRASLSQHLAEFAQVKSVKVIHDSKGGVCAFVQCKDAESATRLIQTLHSSAPKPFLGRILRFEVARAYRSLLISYRTPTQIISTNGGSSTEKIVELDLPSAMRISKYRNSKFAAIFYNDEAIHKEQHAEISIHETSFFRTPVLCDAATLEAICGFFGPLELFQLSKIPGRYGEDSLPAPHDAPRKANMDQGCFEVKWTHRDDCTSALMALRRVPHLTATWAHITSEREVSHLNGANQPYPTIPRMRSVSSSGHSSTKSLVPRPIADDSNGWREVSRPPYIQHDTERAVCLETDFPPLIDRKADFESEFWFEKESSHEIKKETTGGFVDGSSFDITPTPVDFMELLGNVHPLRPDSGYRSMSISTSIADASQELDLQSTPALARSPVTPKTPGSLFPPTPTSFHGERPTLFSKEVDDKLSYGTEGKSGSERILDPSTLFVGGLEIRGSGAWDESKVNRLFEKYGPIEDVKVICPNSGKAAFAFVRFKNTEGPARAIAELHNQLIEGRPIRVQLRDCNPSRSPFRNRGRYPFNYGQQFRQDSPSESKRDKSVDASLTEPALNIEPASEALAIDLVSDSPKAAALNTGVQPPKSETERYSPQMQGPGPYREWYDVENPLYVPVPAPPVSGSFTPEGGAAIPYPVPAFYASGHWMHPPHMQYPMAFYPSMYTVPPNLQPPRYSGSSGSDATGPVSCPPSMSAVPWSASVNYGVMSYLPILDFVTSHPSIFQYIPYHGFPPQLGDQPSPQGQDQAPVVPTGFFRDEAGTLIPVYPRAVIDQYMTSNPSQSSSPVGVPVSIPATVPSPTPISPSGPTQAVVPQPFGLGPNQFPHRMAPLSNHMQGQPNSTWITPAQSMTPQGQLVQGGPPSFGMPMIGVPPFRGHGFRDGLNGGIGPGNGHKRQGRRDHFHGKRNGGPRGRGSGLVSHVEGQMNGNKQTVADWTH
ncbi:hypothetical protein J3R30DRAFT_3697315 [Lentinula aciculospora]|uniref:RRM domain-containing protein n=1 Tax=Lentinula aciculospora TaxID=153920 RepID=A0A9W9ANV4_9AGAR|nr:hypothetical protein J3R30DRAFT_3697315 [Lentinula aciculospora]